MLNTRRFAPSIAALALIAPANADEFAPGHLFVSSTSSDRVVEFDLDGDVVREIGVGTGLDRPTGIAFGPEGHLYAASESTHLVFEFDPSGALVATHGGGAGIANPRDLAFGPRGHLFVASYGTGAVVELDPSGAVVREFSDEVMLSPIDVAIGPDGHVHVLTNKQVLEFDPTGEMIRYTYLNFFSGSAGGAAFGRDGYLHVFFEDEIRRLDDELVYKSEYGGGLSIDDADDMEFGPNGHLFLVDGSEVVEIDPTGSGVELRRIGGFETLVNPHDVAFGPFALSANVTGSLSRPGAAMKTLKEKKARLQIEPGSLRMTLMFSDKPTTSDDFVSLFGASVVAFRGFESGEDDSAKKRLVGGNEISSRAMVDGIASMVLEVKGKVVDGHFAPKSATGTLHRMSTDAAFHAKVVAKKLLK